MATQQSTYLRDPYAIFSNRVRFHLLRDYADQPAPVKLRGILEEALSDTNPLAESLLKEMVYVVLNHPPPTVRGGQRHFVAGINWTNVDPQTKSFLKTALSTDSRAALAGGCEVFLVKSPDEAENIKNLARQLWTNKWAEYWSITKEGVEQNKAYTWNQLLLKPGAEPFPMGLCWDVKSSTQTGQPYFQLSRGVADTIGLGCLAESNSISQLLSLDSKEISRRDLQQINPDEVHELLSLCNAIDGRGSERRNASAIAWKIFHLVRSYAIWGGGAFISIPVVIGTAETSHTAVLSVCTMAPLSAEGLRDWRIIADTLLRPLVEEDMFTLIKEHGFAAAAYGVGHPLKHRFNQVSGGVRTVYAQAVELGEHISLLAKHESVMPLVQLSKRLIDAVDFVYSSSETCRRVSELMNFIASIRTVESPESLDGKYLVKDAYRIADHFPSDQACMPIPFTRWVKGKLKTVEIDPRCLPLLKDRCVRVEPFKSAWGVSRPFDALYDELLFELLLNTVRYGYPDQCILRMWLEMEAHNPPSLMLSNLCRRETIPSNIDPGSWQPWGSGREGGLRFFSDYLSVTEAGSLLCKFEDVDSVPRFTVRLSLSGLTYNKLTTNEHAT